MMHDACWMEIRWYQLLIIVSYSMFNVTAAFTLPIDIIHHTTPTNISEKIHRSKLNRIDLATLDHGRKSVS